MYYLRRQEVGEPLTARRGLRDALVPRFLLTPRTLKTRGGNDLAPGHTAVG